VAGLFFKNREHEVQSFILKFVNNNCPELKAMDEGPRLEARANLTAVVLVIPLEKKTLLLDERFAAVTKEFNTRGVALVLHECRAPDHAILGFRYEGSMRWILAQSKHLSPMGGGFWQLGMRLKQMVLPDDYPELESVYL